MSTILFDNWSLEYATTLLTFSSEKYESFSYMNYAPQISLDESYTGHRNNKVGTIFSELVMTFSLNRFIEALILYDSISYVQPFSNTWKKRNFKELGIIQPFLKEIEMTDDSYKVYKESAKSFLENKSLSKFKKYSSLVTEGAISYLLISQQKEIAYNASPLRSDFITSSGLANLSSFRTSLVNIVDKETREVIEDFNGKLGSTLFEVDVPPITNYVLNEAESLSSIPEVLSQIRESKEAKELRVWLNQMETYVSVGNVIGFKQGMDGVNDILSDFKKNFQDVKSDGSQVQIGLSPSITLPLDSWKKLKGLKTPIHFVLLKDVVDNLLQARNYQKNLERLFKLRYSSGESIENLIEELTKPNNV